MKNIKGLTCDFRDLEADLKAYIKTHRKLKAFERFLKDNIPSNIKGTYSFSGDLGDTCPRVFIDLKKDEQSTINLLKWLAELKKQRFTVEKFWRKDKGYFAYRVQRDYSPYTNYLILIEEAANLDGCVIKEKEVMQKVYYTDCETEKVF